MRVGVPFSIAIHLALAATGIVIAPHLHSEPTPMVILPVELLSIAETTNVAPVAEKQPKDAEKADDSAAKANAAPAPAPAEKPEPLPEPVPSEKPKPPEPKPKQEEAKAAPEAPKKEKMSDALDSILKSVDKKTAKISADRNTTNLAKVGDAARQGVGDNQRMTTDYAHLIGSQLMSKGCWGDKADMPDAKRLRTTIRVRFQKGEGGARLSGEAQLLDPLRQPASDKPMLVFITQALSSLKQCEPFVLPPQYYETSPYIDLTFIPSKVDR